MSKPRHPMRIWRHANGKTLTQLAELVGVTPSHLSEIENWNNDPSLELTSRLYRETGIPMDQFVRPQENAA